VFVIAEVFLRGGLLLTPGELFGPGGSDGHGLFFEHKRDILWAVGGFDSIG
jgi:hypothetical protein